MFGEKELQQTEKKIFQFADAVQKEMFPAIPLSFDENVKLCTACHFNTLCEAYI